MRNTGSVFFEVYPSANGATSTTESTVLFITLFVISFTIAGIFAAMGTWMILPFAGIEMLALAIALYVCRRKLMHREVIEVSDKDVTISCGRKSPENVCVFKRAWAQILMLPSADKDRQSLWIRSHGKQVEVGKYLNFADKCSLADALGKALRADKGGIPIQSQ